jgi:hypothetical protein
MELNDLKSVWKEAGKTSKSEADLYQMTKITNHPSLKKIRTKLIFETIGLVSFLLIYYNWFDGDKKPLYANLLLVAAILLFIFNDVIGYIFMLKPIKASNLKTSIQNYFVRIKRLSVFSIIISLLYCISIVIFFTSVISFTKEKYLILIGIIVTLLVMTYFSSKIWSNWIKNLKQQVVDFDLDSE